MSAAKWHQAGVSRGSPPIFEVGDVVEAVVYDDAGNTQGTLLLGVLETLATHKKGPVVAAMFLAASDMYYHWWMNEGPNAPNKDRGLYHLCAEPAQGCTPSRKHPHMIHSDKYRVLGPDEVTTKRVSWLKDKTIKEAFDFCYKKFQGVAGSGPKQKAPGEGPRTDAEAKWADGDHSPAGDADAGEETASDEADSLEEGMKAKILKLKQELKKAEDDAADHRTRKRKKKKGDPRKGRSSRGHGVPRRSDPGEPVKKRRKSKSPGGDSPRKDKRSKKRRSRSGSKEKKRDVGAKRRRRKSESCETSPDDNSSRDGELFKSKKPEVVKGRSKERDRGPFGGGPPVRFASDSEDSSGDEGSVFRKGSTTSTRSSQQRLLSYTNKYPGRLACRLLQKMETACARGVVGPENTGVNRTPVVAMHHIITVLLPSLGQKAGLRSTRELKTLGAIMDHLAAGAPSKAADVVCQRIKAVERATHEAHWGAAQFLELLPPENSLLLERDEDLFLTKEFLLEQKIRQYDKGTDRRDGGGKGKAKGAKGKTKDKGKSDRGVWDKNEGPAKKAETKWRRRWRNRHPRGRGELFTGLMSGESLYEPF